MNELVRQDRFELIGGEPVFETTCNENLRTNPSHGESRAWKPWHHAQLGHINPDTSC